MVQLLKRENLLFSLYELIIIINGHYIDLNEQIVQAYHENNKDYL
jgi:hypothetical protein